MNFNNEMYKILNNFGHSVFMAALQGQPVNMEKERKKAQIDLCGALLKGNMLNERGRAEIEQGVELAKQIVNDEDKG